MSPDFGTCSVCEKIYNTDNLHICCNCDFDICDYCIEKLGYTLKGEDDRQIIVGCPRCKNWEDEEKALADKEKVVHVRKMFEAFKKKLSQDEWTIFEYLYLKN